MIVIGNETSNITILPGEFRSHPRSRARVCDAKGSFCIVGLSGDFRTVIWDGGLDLFAKDIERIYGEMSGVAKFRTGEEHLGDIELEICIEKLGRVTVDAKIHHQPGFLAEFWFELDQSFLPPIVRSLKATLQA